MIPSRGEPQSDSFVANEMMRIVRGGVGRR
jgi:hypothetical protein